MPAYTVLSDHQFLNENNNMVVLYSPILAPCDLVLFLKLKIRGYNGDSSSVTVVLECITRWEFHRSLQLGPMYNH
jgi:hypothetical protein